MAIRTGARLQSQADDTQVIVVRAVDDLGELTCGGHPMVDVGDTPAAGLAPVPGHDGGTVLGKRYTLEGSELELLATKGGAGSLAVDGTLLVLKSAKPLPASD